MAAVENSVLLSSGYQMPLLGLGTWQSENEEETIEAVKAAIEAGYRHIDTAFSYKNEAIIGKALKEIFEKGTVKRSDLFIVTKLPANGLAEENVEYFYKKSLAALQLDYIDLYLIHGPVATQRTEDDYAYMPMKDGVPLLDLNVSLVKTWKIMETFVDKGLVRSIGLSNFNSKQIQRIVDNARIKPANLQVECHAYLPQYELHEFCKKLNISFTAYAPIGSPGLAEFAKKRHNRVVELPNLLGDASVVALAEKHRKTPAQILLRFLVQRNMIVIPKSVTPRRIRENAQVFDFVLSEDDMQTLKSLSRGHRFFVTAFQGFKDHPEYPFNEPF